MNDAQRTTFWGSVDAKFLIVTAVSVGTLLGPISQFIGGQYQLKLDKAAAAHKQRMDFIDKLVKAQELKDESARVLARLDVLQLLRGTLESGDGMNEFVTEELGRTQKQYDALLELQKARAEVAATAPSPGAADSGAPRPTAQALDAVKRAERQLSERILHTSPVAPVPGIPTPGTPPLPTGPCKRYAVSAPGTAVPAAELEAACRAADAGREAWMARAGNSTVTCSCLAR